MDYLEDEVRIDLQTDVYIESVRLKNFLSFYEGTVELDKGLTVVVGPNGSGKTSIFHAIKFALGSNQRERRYSKWSDFVRHGASSGAVELVAKVNGQSRKFERKISRDGIPRAYIDGRRVKASEMHQLVETLGFDPDNPLVFMPQERINALRNMDPVEVRKLVEEGTGLDELRDRIRLEESRVFQSSESLESTKSEAQVVQKELEFLGHDLERLEKKRRLQKEEKELDLEHKWAALNDLNARINEIRLEIEDKEEGLGSVLEEYSDVESLISEQQDKLELVNQSLQKNQLDIGKTTARIEEEERRLSKLEDSNQRLVEEIRDLEEKVAMEKSKKESLSKDLQRISKAREGYMEEHGAISVEMEEVEQERGVLDEKLDEFAEWNSRRAEVHGDYRALQAEVRSTDLLMRSLREKLQVDEAELQSIENKWGELWDTVDEIDEEDLEERKTQLESDLSELNETRFQRSSRVSELQKKIDALENQLAERSERIPDSVKELRNAIEERQLDNVIGPLLSELSVDEIHGDALEAVLDPNLSFAFLTSSSTDFDLVQKLRDSLAAPAPIVLAQHGESPQRIDISEYPGALGWLWDEIGLEGHEKETIANAIGDYVLTKNSMSAYRLSNKVPLNIVTMDGQVIVNNKKRKISHPRKEPTGIVSLAPLQKELKNTRNELVIARKQLTAVLEKIAGTTTERDKVLDLMSQVSRWSGIWERRKRLLDGIPEQRSEVAVLESKLENLQQELDNAETKLRELDNSQPPERSKLLGQQSALRMKQRRLQKQLRDLDNRLMSSEKNQEVRRQELQNVNENIEMYSERLVEVREELKGSENEGSEILGFIDELKQKIKELESERIQLQNEQKEIDSKISENRQALLEMNLQVRNSRLEVIQAKKQLDAMSSERDMVKDEIEGYVQPAEVRDLEIVRNELIRVRHLLDDYQDVSETIAVTENKLKDRLGNLTKKVAELEAEVSAAEDTINKIREEYHNGMNETLQSVEDNVNEILNSVNFSGEVRFDLSLRNQVYGVDFKCKFRGEEFKELSAGSGGERSLVAIGLILALQRFNPAPVYSLDEIDTFLDATNTEMVSRLLYDSSRNSQFIIFTPAKSTHLLKNADKRLGVVSPRGTEPSVIIESPSFSGQ
ncbi:chromosome segregation protein SMC [Candidatus Thorarchaeota archaeon]|nr:MAG: chromosome segregation protein SMC [Candidatus Thorarchaeota archaeon]